MDEVTSTTILYDGQVTETTDEKQTFVTRPGASSDAPKPPPDDVQRFTTRKKKLTFYIDDDVMYARGKIPAYDLIDLVNEFESLKETDTKGTESFDAALQLFETVLYPQSLNLLQRRMGRNPDGTSAGDVDDPIDIKDLLVIMQWLIGEGYGLRPTQPSDSSSDTHENTGTSSTDGPLPRELTTNELPGTDSST